MHRARLVLGIVGAIVAMVGCGGSDAPSGDAGTDTGMAPADAASPCSAPADCDDDNVCTDDSCEGGTCAHAPNTAPCRAAAGDCDVEEICAAGACPADALAPEGTACRAAMDVCDAEEVCTGSAAECPPHDPAVLADCSDHDACTADACDATTGCRSEITAAALGRALVSGSPDGTHVVLPIQSVSGSVSGLDYEICPGGAQPTASPPQCIVEIDGSAIALTVSRDDATALELVGTVPVRVQDLPVDYTYVTVSDNAMAVMDGGGACPAGPYAVVPFQVGITRSAWPTVSVTLAPDEASVAASTHFCGAVTGSIASVLRTVVQQSILGTLRLGVLATVEAQVCLSADPGPCPTGSSAAPDGICRPDAAPESCIARSESSIDHLVAASCIE